RSSVEQDVAHPSNRRRLLEPTSLRCLVADLVSAIENIAGNEATYGVSQHGLADPVPVDEIGRKRQRELGNSPIEVRQSHLATLGHRISVCVAKEDREARYEALAEKLTRQRTSKAVRLDAGGNNAGRLVA